MKTLFSSKMSIILFLLITVIGIFLRCYWTIKIPLEPFTDFKSYYDLAVNISQGKGHTFQGQPVAFQGMGYPYALGIYFKLTGDTSVDNGKVFNLLLSSFLLPIWFFIFSRFLKKTYLYFAYALFAFLPNYIVYNNVLGTEIFSAFLFSLIILFSLLDFKRLPRLFLIGFLCSFLALTKPYFIIYPILLVMIEWMKTKSFKRCLFSLCIICIPFVCVVAPWTIRNYIDFHRFIPVSYNSGSMLFANNNEANFTGSWMPPANVPVDSSFKQKVSNLHLDLNDGNSSMDSRLEPLYKQYALQWITSHPLQFIELGLIREKNVFFNAEDVEMWSLTPYVYTLEKNISVEDKNLLERKLNVFRAITNVFIYLLSSLTFLYIFIHLKDTIVGFFSKTKKVQPAVSIPVLHTLFFVAVFFCLEGQSRYNFPLLPLFILCSIFIIESVVLRKNNFTSQKEE